MSKIDKKLEERVRRAHQAYAQAWNAVSGRNYLWPDQAQDIIIQDDSELAERAARIWEKEAEEIRKEWVN